MGDSYSLHNRIGCALLAVLWEEETWVRLATSYVQQPEEWSEQGAVRVNHSNYKLIASSRACSLFLISRSFLPVTTNFWTLKNISSEEERI